MRYSTFGKIGITGVGWHTFRHTVGAMLADMAKHQLTIREYLRHSHINVTKQYMQATSKSKRLAQGKLVRCGSAHRIAAAKQRSLIQ